MLQAITRLAMAAPRRVIAAASLVVVAAAIFGFPVIQNLSAGGFRDPASESWHATQLLSDKFSQGDMQIVFAVSSDAGVRSETARAAGADLVAQLKNSPFVTTVQSAWTASPLGESALISNDGKTGLVVGGIAGGENGAQKHAKALAAQLTHERNGVKVTAGGEAMNYVQIIDQTQKDLLTMEAISLPLSFVVLVWVFGGLLAAALPLAVGLIAIVGSMAVLRGVTFATDVSVFALNLALALGLALAVDYTLLIVSRFRDELAGGAARDEALVRTMATAGRTVLFSAVTVALSMVAMFLFPMYFLKSFAYAGVAVVVFAAVAAVVIAPATIVLLGERLDSADVRVFARRLLRRRRRPLPRPTDQTFWYRSTRSAMRMAIPIGLAIVALLLALGIPFLGVKWGYPDDRVLTGAGSARQVGDELRTDFAVNSSDNVAVVIPDIARATPNELTRYAEQLSLVADVSSVSSPGGTFVKGRRVGPASAPTGLNDGAAFFTINSTAPLYSKASEAQLDRLHAVTPPGGRGIELTGWAQINHDAARAVTSRLPLVLAVIGAITLGLLFAMTGSVVLPLKALLLNVMSLSATFGALVWIFQDGHLDGFGTMATGSLITSAPVLLFCLAFGLSMDYEVFLVSRIREYWLASGRTRSENDESVALGVAHTGRVVTAAALLMAISFAALIASKVSFMRMFGLGISLAVLMDATLVRMLLMPAFMHVLGRLNWWAPRPLAWLHQHVSVSDSSNLAEAVRLEVACLRGP
ncbi:MMPL family transporter [Mycobacterium sp. SP-6446]|uniref:MMPL family transporter n=1 Tax=Mycobacterium sp. SP-6446 TaxID=1834162 RepID=UPI00096E9D05|nr:MMPL family transporter [Mycobacterium sp. SP-6446]OMC13547.1 hypothetical protein A5736_23135 [Mycobacterium sp. SP-6446]